MEVDPSFAGFDAKAVNLQTQPGYVSGDPLCLANHFRGRVSCPYGQYAAGAAPAGAGACQTPGGVQVTPSFGAPVEPQCADRTAEEAVYTSCRCANAEGRTDDGARYCACPDDFACNAVVTLVLPHAPSVELAGSYCIKKGTEYAPSACSSSCAPGVASCP
jgi:hypothetical protein